jgi:hypothetical protein
MSWDSDIPIRRTVSSLYNIQLDYRQVDRETIHRHEEMERKRQKRVAAEEEQKRLVELLNPMKCKYCKLAKHYNDMVKLPHTTALRRPLICTACEDAVDATVSREWERLRSEWKDTNNK